MTTVANFREWCAADKTPVAWEVRRLELLELIAVIGVAMTVQSYTRHGETGSGAMVAYLAFQLALPFGAAFSLRRSVGLPALAVAAVLAAGLAAGMGVSLALGRADLLPANAYVAAGMVWVLTNSTHRSMRSMLLAATILAAAMTVASLI
jgi:hypothetical protein